MIYPVYLLFFKMFCQQLIQFLCRMKIAAKWFFDDDPVGRNIICQVILGKK